MEDNDTIEVYQEQVESFSTASDPFYCVFGFFLLGGRLLLAILLKTGLWSDDPHFPETWFNSFIICK